VERKDVVAVKGMVPRKQMARIVEMVEAIAAAKLKH